jgi:hypothetical protein
VRILAGQLSEKRIKKKMAPPHKSLILLLSNSFFLMARASVLCFFVFVGAGHEEGRKKKELSPQS